MCSAMKDSLLIRHLYTDFLLQIKFRAFQFLSLAWVWVWEAAQNLLYLLGPVLVSILLL